MKSKLLFGVLMISLTLMMLTVTPPAASADDNGSLLPPVPVMPPATGKFPGYRPVNKTDFILPPSLGGKAAPTSANPSPSTRHHIPSVNLHHT